MTRTDTDDREITLVGNSQTVKLRMWFEEPESSQPWSWLCGACGLENYSATRTDAQSEGISHVSEEHLK